MKKRIAVLALAVLMAASFSTAALAAPGPLFSGSGRSQPPSEPRLLKAMFHVKHTFVNHQPVPVPSHTQFPSTSRI